MAKRVRIAEPTVKCIQPTEPTVRRIDPEAVAAALGGEPCAECAAGRPWPIPLEVLRKVQKLSEGASKCP
jgi:hypothetical protein